MTGRVDIVEVGPRDGLQNEAEFIATERKIALIDCLSRAGFRRIEVASFVSPKWVPQMADGARVLKGVKRRPGVLLTALTPNLTGFRRALTAAVDEIAIFVSATEGFSQANLNASIAEVAEKSRVLAEAAHSVGVPVRGYVSCVTDCPYDGPTPPQSAALAVEMLRDMGCYEVSLGDTIGKATPERVEKLLETVLKVCPAEALAGHFHDTDGHAIENIDVSLSLGLRVFDAAVGGLGGCPYAPGATGNVATEAVVRHLTEQGYDCGLDIAIIEEAAAMAKEMRSV
ncbi:MAG: hydroxymethylglutaryl-CoA lyase [Pseudomonadota bacterium]